MDKLNEYFKNLEQKEYILIYLSVVIIFVIIYYLFNMSLSEEVDRSYVKMQKAYKKSKVTIKKFQNQLLAKKMKYKKILSSQIRQDYKYLVMRLDLSKKLHIDENRYLDILNTLMKDSINKNLNASFKISKKDDKDILKYNLLIKGTGNIYSLYFFIKDIESKNVIKEINTLNYDGNQSYTLNVIIWSLK